MCHQYETLSRYFTISFTSQVFKALWVTVTAPLNSDLPRFRGSTATVLASAGHLPGQWPQSRRSPSPLFNEWRRKRMDRTPKDPGLAISLIINNASYFMVLSSLSGTVLPAMETITPVGWMTYGGTRGQALCSDTLLQAAELGLKPTAGLRVQCSG